MMAALARGHPDGPTGPARHLRRLPQPGPAGQAGRHGGRHVRRSAHLRHRRRLVRRGVPVPRLDLPPDRQRLELLEETIQIAKAMWTEPSADRPRAPRLGRRRHLVPQAAPVTSAHLGRRRRREGHPAHRRRTRRTPPTGRSALEEFLPQVRGPAGPLRGRRPGLRRHRPHPRPRLPPLRHRGRPGALAGRARRRRPLGQGGPRDLRPGQLRRHRRPGRREGPGLPRRRLPRVRPLVPRLPRRRVHGALHGRRRPEAAPPRSATAPDVPRNARPW